MSLTMRWVDESDFERVAQTRWLCYSHAGRELARHQDVMQFDRRAIAGDYLLAEENGRAVGTTTSLSMTMWVRGSAIPCQGIAWVGTIKSARRRGGTERGVASALMNSALDLARQRKQIVSALMPFRGSFYEHFGYGMVERRNEWTIPMSVLPRGDASGWQPLTESDYPAQTQMRQKVVQVGQCDIERPTAAWPFYRTLAHDNGMTFIHSDGSWVNFNSTQSEGKYTLVVNEWCADSPTGFESILRFLGTLSDQYIAVVLYAPVDWPVNRLLRENQVPHRPTAHLTAQAKMQNRLQIRILDHARFLESLHMPQSARGQVSVAIHECEGKTSQFSMEFNSGRVAVKPHSGQADIECTDSQWASVATGDLPATMAVRFGLAKQYKGGAAGLLDALAAGPLPFTQEAF